MHSRWPIPSFVAAHQRELIASCETSGCLQVGQDPRQRRRCQREGETQSSYRVREARQPGRMVIARDRRSGVSRRILGASTLRPRASPPEPHAHLVAAGTPFSKTADTLTSGGDFRGRGLGGDMPTTGGVAAMSAPGRLGSRLRARGPLPSKLVMTLVSKPRTRRQAQPSRDT
jgi:hypothetical protein